MNKPTSKLVESSIPFWFFKLHSLLSFCKEEGSLDGCRLKMEKKLSQEGEQEEKERREAEKHFLEWVCQRRQRVLFPDSSGPKEHQGRGKGTFSLLPKGRKFLELTSALFIFTIQPKVEFQVTGPSPYNCQEAVAFRRCELATETLLCYVLAA